MTTFWDTSALIPLVLEEAKSPTALEIWQETKTCWAWDWIYLEGESAISRKNNTPAVWKQWIAVNQQFHCVGLQADQHRALRMMNRSLKLRAADAGHVFVYDRLLEVIPDLTMVSFDQEILDALDHLGLPVHPSCR